MSGTNIPLMARGIDPTAAYGAYNSMLKTGAEIPLVQAQTGEATARAGESRARTGLVQAQTGEATARAGESRARTGLIGQQTGEATARAGESRARTGLIGQQTGEATARAGLIGQQTAGENIKNQLAGLNLGFTKGVYDSFNGQGGAWQQPGALPWDSEGGSGPSGADVATGNAPAGTVASPGAMGGGSSSEPLAAPTGASGPVLPGPQGGAIGAGGASGSGGGGAGGIGARSSSGAPFTGPGGVMLPSGIAVPKEDFLGWAQAQDKTKAMQQVIANKNMRLSQLVASTMDPQTGRPDPQAWNAAVKQAFYGGLIDNAQAARFYNHPEIMGAVQSSTLAPNEQPGVRQQQAAATATGTGAGGAPFDLVDVPIRNADGTTSTVKMTRADALARGSQNGGQTGAQLATPTAPITGQEYSNRLRMHENPGGNPAQANTSGPGGTPTSSAVGDHQWTNDTWVNVLTRNRPDLVANKSREQILSMRTDSSLSTQMAQAYAKENAGALAAANLPINAATLGLAHGFGGAGAVKILQSPSATPLTTVFPPDAQGRPNPVIAANPTYARDTVGSMVGHYVQGFGTGPVDFSNPTGAAAPPPGTIGAGPVEFSPQQKLRIDADTTQIKEDAPNVTAAQTGAMHASSAMPVLLSVRDLAARIPTGSYGDARAGIANFLQTFSPDWANKFLAATTADKIDPSKAGAMQEFVKQTFQTVTSAESQFAGARIGARLTEFFSKAMPNINMQGDAVRDMVNFLLIGNQMVKDYGNGASTHFNASRDAFLEQPTANRYQPLSKYDQSWLASDGAHTPQVYESAAMALNRRPFAEWSKGLSPVQKHSVIDTIRAADPQSGGAFNGAGTWVPVSQFPAAGMAPRIAEPAGAGG